MTLQTYMQDQAITSQYQAATVIGLGVTGYSAVRYFLARGLSVSVFDSRPKPPLSAELANNFPEVDCHFGDFDDAGLDGVSLIVASPGVSLKEPMLRAAKSNGALIVGDVELFLQENTKPVVAITLSLIHI